MPGIAHDYSLIRLGFARASAVLGGRCGGRWTLMVWTRSTSPSRFAAAYPIHRRPKLLACIFGWSMNFRAAKILVDHVSIPLEKQRLGLLSKDTKTYFVDPLRQHTPPLTVPGIPAAAHTRRWGGWVRACGRMRCRCTLSWAYVRRWLAALLPS